MEKHLQVKMVNQTNESWTNERMQKLKEGDFVAPLAVDFNIPPWYDEKLFNKAKEVYKEYFASILLCHICGLLTGFYFLKMLKVLTSTDESTSKTKLFRRYLSTSYRIHKWYIGNVWDPADSANKSILAVRSMHARASKNMATLNDGVLYVSQWDLSSTQCAFIGPIILLRSKVGFHSCTEEEYKSLFHFWRVMGYLLGIEDQYNFCTGNYEQVFKVCQAMNEECKHRVATENPSSEAMCQNVVDAMNMISPIFRWKTFKNIIYESLDIPCSFPMSFTDRIHSLLMKFLMAYILKFKIARNLINAMLLSFYERIAKEYLNFKDE